MTVTDRLPAEVFPVGEYLRDEIEARGWTVAEFAAILGRPTPAISEILNGHKEITAQTATEIAAATGTEAATWLRLQDSYQLWAIAQHPKGSRLDEVARRARLRNLTPLTELIRRGIVPEGDLDAQERAVQDLLGISTLDQDTGFALAARRSDAGAELSPAQRTWAACVRRAASATQPALYDPARLLSIAETLTRTVTEPEHLVRLPAVLADVGVRIVYVPHFESSKIDGAALDGGQGPVIGLSGRIAKFDAVLFTALHEIAHIYRGDVDDGIVVDVDLSSPARSDRERACDQLATGWAIPGGSVVTAGLRTGRLSGARVRAAAAEIGVHPAVVVGRLHHDGMLPWTHLNRLIPSNVRPHLERWGEVAA